MEHLHSELDISDGQAVHVVLSGNAANVILLDDDNYARYQQGESYTYRAGGFFTKSPAVLRPPMPGRWHLVVDLAGTPGEVRASVSIRPA